MFTAPPPAFAINGTLWKSQSGTFLCLNTKPVKFQTTAMIFFFYYHKTMKWGFSLFSNYVTDNIVNIQKLVDVYVLSYSV